MLILVEGADGSGKSYLVSELYKEGFAIQKVKWHQNFDFNKAAAYCWYDGINLVEDRSPITDIVYRIFDEQKPDRTENIDDVLEWVRCFGVKIIYCKTKTSYTDSINRGEENITSFQDHCEISKIYDIVMAIIKRDYPSAVLEYDHSKQNVNDVLKFINTQGE